MTIRKGMSLFLTVCFAACVGTGLRGAEESELAAPHLYDVTWRTPSADASGTMPLGNGDIGLNAWIDEEGRLVFYISKTDSWGDNGRLLKVGRVRIALSESPIDATGAFEQTLSLADATMKVRFGKAGGGEAEDGGPTELRLWVDANRPVIDVEIDAAHSVEAVATIDLWRTAPFTLPGVECSDIMLDRSKPDQQHGPTVVEADSLLENLENRIGWYHHNAKSVGPRLTAELQGLAGFERPDPLLHRTFGAVVTAPGAERIDDLRLRSPRGTTHRFSIHVLTVHPATAESWLAAMDETIDATEAIPYEKRRAAHRRWWEDFWNRSWIHVTRAESATPPSLVPAGEHPIRIGIDQHGQNTFSGELGRLSIVQAPLDEDAIARLAETGHRQRFSEPLSDDGDLLFSAVPEIPATLESTTGCTFEKGMTVEAWVKPDRLPPSGARLVDKITPGGEDGFLFDTWPANSLRFIVGRSVLEQKDALRADEWSHVAAVVDPAGQRLRLFVNGTLCAEREVAGGDEAATVSRAYALQRFINACAGRGRYPIKFNGSIFTVPHDGKPGDADYRRWGPGYWWQNTRLPYISMCASGDFDLMRPLFTMYADELMPLCVYRTRLYMGHGGAFIPECIYFWGDVFTESYGWTPFEEREDKLQTSGWHKWEWVSGPELVFMMLDYFDHTLDEAFLRRSLLPSAREILTFFDEHYATDGAGKLVMHPSQACETWWDCTNPMPEVAGLHAVVDRLRALPEKLTSADERAFWAAFKKKIPELPLREKDGKKMLAPATRFESKRNIENPELYAVFPFRQIAVGKPGIELGRRALAERWDKGNFGWRQDDVFMAYLGLADEARRFLAGRARNKHTGSRFPAFWGPNYDWIPDQDHGSIVLKALQAMLMQTDGRKIYLLPAWPKDWNAAFKLHAPYATTLCGRVVDGRITDLVVMPEKRRDDLIFLEAQ